MIELFFVIVMAVICSVLTLTYGPTLLGLGAVSAMKAVNKATDTPAARWRAYSEQANWLLRQKAHLSDRDWLKLCNQFRRAWGEPERHPRNTRSSR